MTREQDLIRQAYALLMRADELLSVAIGHDAFPLTEEAEAVKFSQEILAWHNAAEKLEKED